MGTLQKYEHVVTEAAADSEWQKRARRWLPVLAVHLAVVLVWEFAVRLFHVPSFILPAPSKILATLGVAEYRWGFNTLVTAIEIISGYALGVILAVFTALLFVSVQSLMKFVFPLLVTLNMVPKVALGPLIIVWFKYGIGPNILMTFSLCYFPILLTTLRGLNETDPDLADLVRALRGSRWQLFRYIQLPGALPYVFSGMKVAAVLAVAGAVVGEFIASDKGLGYLMIQVQSSMATAAEFMAVLLITLIGVLLYMSALLAEHVFVTKDARMK
jgi:NitT/TauT family transport system permease protein